MVIKTISSEYGARCDMAKVSKLVKEKLSQVARFATFFYNKIY